jgi:hypothetical protein
MQTQAHLSERYGDNRIADDVVEATEECAGTVKAVIGEGEAVQWAESDLEENAENEEETHKGMWTVPHVELETAGE